MKWLPLVLGVCLLMNSIGISFMAKGLVTQNKRVADVLIFTGAGAWNDGVVAFENFLTFKGMTWYECEDTYIENNDLTGMFGAIHFPGGDSGQYIERINEIGLQHIRDFVAAGGGYIGICAGGYFACDRIIWEGNSYDNPLNLFDGVGYGAIDEIIPWSGYAMTTITMNLSNQINRYEPSSECIMYYGGAAFFPDEGQEMNVIGTYDAFRDNPAIINYTYGEGRILLFGPHPEIEEDSARDNASFADNLLDLGTDWNLLWSSMDWLMGLPISQPPATSPPTQPVIEGPTRGKSGVEYGYRIVTIDPELEELYVCIDWGDGNLSEWLGLFDSGEIVRASYTWEHKGEYAIKVIARDVNGAESEWSDPLPITMPKPYENLFQYFIERLFEWFFSIIFKTNI